MVFSTTLESEDSFVVEKIGGIMKKLKLALAWLLLLVAMGLVFTGCKSEEEDKGDPAPIETPGGDEPSKDAPVEIVTGDFKEKILKNKVVMLDGSGDVYYEYLKFTSESAGEYSLYKDGKKQDTYKDKTLPTAFTYSKANGEVKVGDISSYIYDYKHGDEDKRGIADEILSAKDKGSLYTTWTSGKRGLNFTFKAAEVDDEDDAICTIKGKDGGSITTGIQIDEGHFTIQEKMPFFWTKLNGENTLYFMAYETERIEVSEVGRASMTNVVETEFGRFIFAALN